jgi:hypothetical protein
VLVDRLCCGLSLLYTHPYYRVISPSNFTAPEQQQQQLL